MDAVPESPRDRARRERAERAARQEERAAEAIRAIVSGGDLSAETLALSNEFTDETSARLRKRFRRSRPTG